ncbi:sprouty homolog 1 (Drosophila), isoform CRA_b [Mus musculus]|nr:sprouty homolog 1 (Drosophila), isoform CRA_b [Mus musculus]
MDSPSQHGSHTSLVVIQPPAVEGRQRLDYDRDTQPATILSLDQIKAIRGSNEYTEGPSVARRLLLRTRFSQPSSPYSPLNPPPHNALRRCQWVVPAHPFGIALCGVGLHIRYDVGNPFPPPAPSICEGLPFTPPLH